MADRRKKAKRVAPRDSRPTIGFLTYGSADQISGALQSGMHDFAQNQGANLLCFAGGRLKHPYGFEAQANILYDLVSVEKLDGLVIWTGALMHEVGFAGIRDFCVRYQPLPVISLAIVLEDIPSITVDNYKGMHDVVTHLIETHSCRRLAFIRGPQGHQEAEERYRAYAEALAEHDIPLDANLVAPGYFTEPSGAEAIELLLDQRKVDFEAVVAASDGMALGALRVLQARGRRVPGDVAVMGFDDIAEAGSVTPPLTTVHYPFYEQGWRAAEMLLTLLAGEQVPEKVLLPTMLVVRQSCGCESPMVGHAAAGRVEMTGEPFETAFVTQRQHIFEIVKAMGESTAGTISGWAEQFVDAFAADLTGRSPGVFLSTLDDVLRQVLTTGGEVMVWQEALSTLRRQVLPYLGDAAMSARAEDLWQQARTMIGEIAQRVQAYRRLQSERQTRTLAAISQALLTTFDVDTLTDIVAQELPRLDIPSGYLALYEGQGTPPEWSRLILAYDEKGRAELEKDGRRFPSRQLLPEDLWPSKRRYSMMIESLYFREEQLGFVVFEMGPREGLAYEALRGQLSSALRGMSLVRQVEEHTRALQEANYALQRRAIQLEATVEVGRAITSTFDIDLLLRQTVDLISNRFGFYHAGIFLLDEIGKWAVLREATGEAGTQMKTQGHRLEVGESSMVGWTALHRQPRIALDVGKDAVRFANPLLPYTRSEMTLPLTVGDRLLGVLNVQSTEEAAFDEDDVRTLQSMANQIAIAIENAQRVSSETLLLEATSPIYRASSRLTAATATSEVADAIIASVAETGADGCTVVMFEFSPEGEPETLLYLGVWRRDRAPQFQPGMRLPISESPFPLQMVSTLWTVADVEHDENLPRSAHLVFQATGAKALVNIPLRSGDKVIGQVVVLRATPGPFPDSALRLYEVLSDQAAVALERARLLEEAQRRAQQEQLTRQMADHIRRAVDVEQALQIAARELAQAMEVPHVSIELGLEPSGHT